MVISSVLDYESVWTLMVDIWTPFCNRDCFAVIVSFWKIAFLMCCWKQIISRSRNWTHLQFNIQCSNGCQCVRCNFQWFLFSLMSVTVLYIGAAFFRDTLYSPWRKSKGKLCFLSPWRRVRMHQNTPFWNKKKPSGGARRLQRLKLWTPHSEILRTPMIKTAPTMQQNTLSVDNKIHLFLGSDCTLPGLTVVEEDTSPVVHTPPANLSSSWQQATLKSP